MSGIAALVFAFGPEPIALRGEITSGVRSSAGRAHGGVARGFAIDKPEPSR